MKTKSGKQAAVDLGTLQANAERATANLKAATTKLSAAEQAFARAEHEHTVAIRTLGEGIKAVNSSCRPQI